MEQANCMIQIINQWLQANDIVKMTIDGLGTLENTIKAEATEWSILALKK